MGLNNKPILLEDFVRDLGGPLSAAGNEILGMKVVVRNRDFQVPYRTGQILVEVDNGKEGEFVANEETGFFIVGPTESVIFISIPNSEAPGKLFRCTL